MNRQWQQYAIAILSAYIAPGCVTVHAPLVTDKSYPNNWGELLELGPECKAIEGVYWNEGVTPSADGTIQPVMLTSALNLHRNAQTVSLSVRVRQFDRHGDAFVTLGVVPDNNVADLHELESCFCIKQTLACTQISETYWSVPNFGVGGEQSNIYFSISHDHSLVAKMQNYHADVILVLPVFGIKEPWVRFSRVEQ
jgi:hypothetical protein